jgi:hypothetical protein
MEGAHAMITMNPELQSLIPPLTPEEYAQLEANIVADGCRDPLIVWQEEQCLLDGHNRYAICERYALGYTTQEVSLTDLDAAKAWMIAHQLGRRNLTLDQMRYYRGKQYELHKKVKRGGGDRKSPAARDQKPQSEAFDTTAHELAVQHKVSKATIERDAVYAKAIDTIADVVGIEARQALLSPETKVTQQEVKALAKIATKHALTAKEALDAVQGAKTPKQARQIVREKVREVREYEEGMARMIRSTTPEDELPACYRAKPTPAPTDGLASRFRQSLRSLEVLHTCLQMVSLPDDLDPHREACLALGKAYRQIEQLMGQHTAIRYGLFGMAPVPTTTAPAPAAPESQPAPGAQRKPGALIQVVWEALQHHAPCSNAQVAQVTGESRKHVHKALQSLVKQGKARKEGLTYSVVEAPTGKAIADGVVV